MFDRITFDPRIFGGRASIRGMRIPVSVIVGQIAHGASGDEVLADYPDLKPEDIRASPSRNHARPFSRQRQPFMSVLQRLFGRGSDHVHCG